MNVTPLEVSDCFGNTLIGCMANTIDRGPWETTSILADIFNMFNEWEDLEAFANWASTNTVEVVKRYNSLKEYAALQEEFDRISNLLIEAGERQNEYLENIGYCGNTRPFIYKERYLHD